MDVVVTIVTWVAAGLLLVAGWSKLRDPSSTSPALALAGLPQRPGLARILGGLESVVGGGVLLVGGPGWLAALAGLYLGFTLVALRGLRQPAAGCGCFGDARAPMTRLHVVVDAVLASSAVLAGLQDAAPVTSLATGDAAMVGTSWLLLLLGVVLVRSLLVDVPALIAAMRRIEGVQ